MKKYIEIALIFMMAGGSSAALASTILYQGQNAALFPGANPSDQGLLLESVNRPANPATSTVGQLSPASLIEQSVENQISTQIYNKIFNSSDASGAFNLGGGNQINFVRAGGNLVINVTDPANGTTTITLPDL